MSKSAFLSDIFGLSRIQEELKQTKKDVLEVKDIEGARERAKIRLTPILVYLMLNDPIISTFPRTQVISAYNELSRMAPIAMQDPSVIRVMLRKKLTATLDAFDVKQLSELNSSQAKQMLFSELYSAGEEGGMVRI